MSNMTGAKQGIARSDIRALIDGFYARVRKDDRLGPIFARHVGTTDADWAPHLRKIEDFWANVMLHDRVYSGNPMQVHRGIAGLQQDDFARWLEIFDQAAEDILPSAKAQVFHVLAHRIGRSLSMGLMQANRHAPPSLAG